MARHTEQIRDTEIWIVGPAEDVELVQDAITRLGYVAYGAPPYAGKGADRRHRAYMRVLCRMAIDPPAANAA